MSLKRKLPNTSTYEEEEHYELYDLSDEDSVNTDYNNLYEWMDYRQEINPYHSDYVYEDDEVDQTDGDVIVDEKDVYIEEDDDEDYELDEEVVLLDQTDGEDRNCSNNASANITSNKASTNLTKSNLTSGPSSTRPRYPIFHPQTTQTKDTSLKHANQTYIRPKVTPMDSQLLTSIKTSKVPIKNAPPKSSAPNLLPEIKLVATNHVLKNKIKQPSKTIVTTKMKAPVLLPIHGDQMVNAYVVPSDLKNKHNLLQKINILQDQTKTLSSRLSQLSTQITASSTTNASSVNTHISSPHNSTKNKKTAKKFRRHQRQKANKKIDKAATTSHVSLNPLTTQHPSRSN